MGLGRAPSTWPPALGTPLVTVKFIVCLAVLGPSGGLQDLLCSFFFFQLQHVGSSCPIRGWTQTPALGAQSW